MLLAVATEKVREFDVVWKVVSMNTVRTACGRYEDMATVYRRSVELLKRYSLQTTAPVLRRRRRL